MYCIGISTVTPKICRRPLQDHRGPHLYSIAVVSKFLWSTCVHPVFLEALSSSRYQLQGKKSLKMLAAEPMETVRHV
jgi:hypothetical protein